MNYNQYYIKYDISKFLYTPQVKEFLNMDCNFSVICRTKDYADVLAERGITPKVLESIDDLENIDLFRTVILAGFDDYSPALLSVCNKLKEKDYDIRINSKDIDTLKEENPEGLNRYDFLKDSMKHTEYLLFPIFMKYPRMSLTEKSDALQMSCEIIKNLDLLEQEIYLERLHDLTDIRIEVLRGYATIDDLPF